MSAKRTINDNVASAKKRPRKSVNLEVKMDILKRYEAGEKTIHIARTLGIPYTTVRCIRVHAGKILQSAKNVSPLTATKITCIRSGILENTERLLISWIEDQQQRSLPISKLCIQKKAKSLYEDLKKNHGESTEKKNFAASHGWFERFKRRICLDNIQLSSQVARNDPDSLQEVEGEAGLCNVQHAVASGKKRNRRSVNLDIKLKVLKRYEAGERTSHIARALSLPQTTVSSIRVHAEKILQSAKNISPLTATKITCSRRGILENMERLLSAWIEDQKQRSMRVTMLIIQKKAKSLFEDLKKMNGEGSEMGSFAASHGWFERFKKRNSPLNNKLSLESEATESEATRNEEPDCVKEVLNEAGLDSVEQSDGFLKSKGEDLSNDNMNISQPQQQAGEEDDEAIQLEPPAISCKRLAEAFTHLEAAMEIFREDDPNGDRSARVNRVLTSCVDDYKELYQQNKRNAIQISLNWFYKRSAMRPNSPEKSPQERSPPLVNVPVAITQSSEEETGVPALSSE